MPGRAVKTEVEMVNDTLDIERCIWDLDYRSKVKRMLNFHADSRAPSANQNMRPLAAREDIAAKPPEAPRAT